MGFVDRLSRSWTCKGGRTCLCFALPVTLTLPVRQQTVTGRATGRAPAAAPAAAAGNVASLASTSHTTVACQNGHLACLCLAILDELI